MRIIISAQQHNENREAGQPFIPYIKVHRILLLMAFMDSIQAVYLEATENVTHFVDSNIRTRLCIIESIVVTSTCGSTCS